MRGLMEPTAGETIYQFAQRVVDSLHTSDRVSAKFNDIKLYISGSSNADDIADIYLLKMKLKAYTL